MELQPGPAFDQILNEGLFDGFDSRSISNDEMVGIILSGFPRSFSVAPWDLTIVGEVAQPCSEFEEQSVPAITQPISIVAKPPSQTSSSIVRSSEAEGTLSRKHNSHQKWEEYKDIIRSWYINKGNTLPATMKMMRDEHQFLASDKAYKRRLKAWKFERNSRKKGRLVMGTTSRESRQAVREIVNTMSGIDELPNSRDHYKDEDSRQCSDASSTSSTVTCFTPRPHKRKRGSSNNRLAEMTGSFERLDTNMLLSTVSLITTDSAPPASLILLVHNPLFRTTLEPLKVTLMQKLALVPSDALIAPKPYNSEVSNEIISALDAFTRNCKEE